MGTYVLAAAVILMAIGLAGPFIHAGMHDEDEETLDDEG